MTVKRRNPVPSDLEIAQETDLLSIREVAERLGVLDDELLPYGHVMAKIDAAARFCALSTTR